MQKSSHCSFPRILLSLRSCPPTLQATYTVHLWQCLMIVAASLHIQCSKLTSVSSGWVVQDVTGRGVRSAYHTQKGRHNYSIVHNSFGLHGKSTSSKTPLESFQYGWVCCLDLVFYILWWYTFGRHESTKTTATLNRFIGNFANDIRVLFVPWLCVWCLRICMCARVCVGGVNDCFFFCPTSTPAKLSVFCYYNIIYNTVKCHIEIQRLQKLVTSLIWIKA